MIAFVKNKSALPLIIAFLCCYKSAIDASEDTNLSKISRKMKTRNSIVVKHKIDVNRDSDKKLRHISGKDLSSVLLGRSFNEKTEQFTQAQFVDTSSDEIVIKKNVTNSYSTTEYMSSQDYIDNMLYIEGGGSVSFLIISGSAKIVYEEIYRSNKKSIILYQVGWKEYETEEISQVVLQNEKNYNNAKYIHSAAKQTKEELDNYLDEYGRYYVSKLYKGLYAVRKIIFNFDSEETKNLIEANVKVKIGIGFLSFTIPVVFRELSQAQREKTTIKIEKETIGGNPNHLDLTSYDVDHIEEQLSSSWDKFMNDPVLLGVLSAEMSLVSSAIHRQYDVNIYDQMKLSQKVTECRNRINELDQQLAIIDSTKTKMEMALKEEGDGAKQLYINIFERMAKDFEEYHLQIVKKNLEAYLVQDQGTILRKEIPPKGTSPAFAELQKIDEYESNERWLQHITLDEDQMNDIFYQLKGDFLFVTKITEPDTNKIYPILWDGPVAYGSTAGIPNSIYFYHYDDDLSRMSLTEKMSSKKFSILGEDWNPLDKRPKSGANIIPNPSIPIDFEKLPKFISDMSYKMTREYSNPPRTYVGFWKREFFYGNGTLINTGYARNSFVSCFLHWTPDSTMHYTDRLEFIDGSIYKGPVKYNQSEMSVVMHGWGTKVNEKKNEAQKIQGCWIDGNYTGNYPEIVREQCSF